MKTISIINLKGGVGKTTTAVNMAYILSQRCGYKVLLLDNDKQGNLSKSYKLYNEHDIYTVARLLTDKEPNTQQIIKKTEYKNLDIITANMNLLGANMQTMMDQTRQQQTRYKKALAAVKDNYDFCIIDNAPDINISIINALVVTDLVIIPIIIDQYSFAGLDILQEQLQQVKEDFNPDLSERILVTQYQNDDVTNSGVEALRYSPVYKTFNNHIRRTNRKVNESTFVQKPVIEYSPRCGAAQDYKKFVEEFLEVVGGHWPL